MPGILLCSTDGDSFEVDIAVAKMSMTIRAMMEDMGCNENNGEMIKVPKVNSKIMRLVVEWARHHVNDKPVDPTDEDDLSEEELPRRSDDIDEWDLEFLKPLDTSELFELIMAANYLHIKGLLAVASKAVANLIKGKTPSQIREVFNLNPRDHSCDAVNDDDSSH